MRNILLLLFLAVSCISSEQIKTKPITEISQKDKKNGVLIDVRTPEEFAAGHLVGAVNVNWKTPDFLEQFSNFDKEKPIYLYCKKGGRSAKAAALLYKNGYHNVVDLLGGYDAVKAEKQD